MEGSSPAPKRRPTSSAAMSPRRSVRRSLFPSSPSRTTTTSASMAISNTVEIPPPPAAGSQDAQQTRPRIPLQETPANVKKLPPSQSPANLPPSQLSEANNQFPAPGKNPPRAGISSPSSTNELHGLREEEAPPGSVPRDAAAAAAGEKKKKKPREAFARVWSVADEVRILECLAAHSKAHGSPPARAQLRGVVAGRLVDKTEFTLIEIYEKVRRLRTRYHNLRAAAGAPRSGEERRKYELSKEIWGNNSPLRPPNRANKDGGSHEDTSVRMGFEELRRMYPHLTVAVEQISTTKHGYDLKRAFELIDDGKAGELDAKVKKQRLLEIETELNRRNLRNQVLSTLIRYVD